MTVYHPDFTDKEKADADKLFEHVEKMTERLILHEIPLHVPSNGIINWSCAWNETKGVGRKVTIIASTGKLCLVVFHDDSGLKNPHNVYRNEDITTILTKAEHTEISKEVEALGLPTYKYPEA